MSDPRRESQSRLAKLAKPLVAEDAVPAALAGGLALVVYVITLAPTVTFKDAGELIIAATEWGVPHPTGYPLWTALAGLWSLLPLGSGAFEVNLFSAVCAALAVALTAGLMHRMGRNLGFERRAAGLVALAVSLMLAWSVTVWSQAVFAEVYTLHVLVVAIFWWALYRWYVEPEWDRGFLLCLFVLALGMSNHHLMLALAPLPLLVTALIRRDLLSELLGYSLAAGSLFFLGFAALAKNVLTWETALRTGQVAALVVVALLLLRRRLEHWRLGLWVPVAIALGLLPYVYMPLASSTNPPMNWGYTQTADGFFYSVNRSPYRGPLSDQLMGTLGQLVGTAEFENPRHTAADGGAGKASSSLGLLSSFTGRYALETSKSFTFLAWPICFWGVWCLRRRSGGWLLVMGVGFVLSVLFQPASAAFAGAAARLEWNLQMPYLGYSCIPLALLLGHGLLCVYRQLADRSAFAGRLALLTFSLAPLAGLNANWQECSQGGRWFAWEFGHDMLDPLPPGSVLFGGSDAGRFIPTYMIFGESFESARHKRDPSFDRRDVYLITQTQLLARFYRQYIRDHYGQERPEPGLVGRFLGRGGAYPEKSLVLPSEDDVALIIRGLDERGGSIDELPSDIAQWIYLRNREEHTFFVEDSLEMPWTRPIAIPEGPVYRLAKAPLAELTDEDLALDKSYWRRKISRLVADPEFKNDLDARLAFSGLRQQGAKIYRQRGLYADAEDAYRQAIEIIPNELTAILGLADLYAAQGRFEEARRVIGGFRNLSPVLATLEESWRNRQQQAQIRGALVTQLLLAPNDPEALRQALQVFAGAEGDPLQVLNLSGDLDAIGQDASNAIALRRVLGQLRSLELPGLADYLARRQLEQAPSLRLAQLLVSDQSLSLPRLDDAGRELRAKLAEISLVFGEADLSLRLLTGQRRDGDVARVREKALQLRETQRSLAPILDRWSKGDRSFVGMGKGQPPRSLGARLERLGTLLAAYQQAPTPERLRSLVLAYRQLRLPSAARSTLAASRVSQNQSLLIEAVRLAALDCQPTLLTAVADSLEVMNPSQPDGWIAIASLRLVVNDQEGLRRAVEKLTSQVGREGLLASFSTNSILEGLSRDTRFRQFLYIAEPDAAAGAGN